MTDDKTTDTFYVSLHDGGGVELSYPTYRRQRVFRAGDGWRCGDVRLLDDPNFPSPVEFPACTGRSAPAAQYGVALSADGPPVLLTDIRPPICVAGTIATITPQLYLSSAVFEVLSRVRAVAARRSQLFDDGTLLSALRSGRWFRRRSWRDQGVTHRQYQLRGDALWMRDRDRGQLEPGAESELKAGRNVPFDLAEILADDWETVG